MHSVKNNQQSGSGFTIVEVIVTVAITALFLAFFFQMFLATESQRVAVARQAQASDLAYSNLRKFASKPNISVSQAVCQSTMDLTAVDASSKPGLKLGDETNMDSPSVYGFQAEPAAATQTLGGNVHQTVNAFAPQGCSGSALTDAPLKIESTITYGPNNTKVVHASYVN